MLAGVFYRCRRGMTYIGLILHSATRPEAEAVLAPLDHAQLEHTTVVRDLFDDDEWLLAGIHLADGSRFAFRVEIDHNADSAVANAMAMPTAVDEVIERLRSAASADEVETPAEESE